MLKKIAALLRKKPVEPEIIPNFPIAKKRPTVKKATTKAVKKPLAKKVVKDASKKTPSKKN